VTRPTIAAWIKLTVRQILRESHARRHDPPIVVGRVGPLRAVLSRKFVSPFSLLQNQHPDFFYHEIFSPKTARTE
jgi:hypothetical protein